MEIRGNSYQEKGPSPTEPAEIKHNNYICVNINGQLLNVPYDPKIKRLKDFVKINGKWCARFEPIAKE